MQAIVADNAKSTQEFVKKDNLSRKTALSMIWVKEGIGKNQKLAAKWVSNSNI